MYVSNETLLEYRYREVCKSKLLLQKQECLLLYFCSHSEDVKNLLTALTSDKGAAAASAAYEQYTANWGTSPGKNDIKKTIVDIETDYIFLVPTQTALYLHAQHAKWVNSYSCQYKQN